MEFFRLKNLTLQAANLKVCPSHPRVKIFVADGKEQNDPKMSIVFFLIIKKSCKNTQHSGEKKQKETVRALLLQEGSSTSWFPEAPFLPQSALVLSRGVLSKMLSSVFWLPCAPEIHISSQDRDTTCLYHPPSLCKWSDLNTLLCTSHFWLVH